jgi:hydroxyquinol 1,2-dioxygenase
LRNLTGDNITQAVIARLGATPDPRARELMTSLVQHLHAFARDVRLTESEWAHGIRFLSEVGQGDDRAQAFGLLSDTLGLSMLAVAMNNGRAPDCTAAAGGEPSLVRGRVLGADGQPVAGAVVEVAPAGVLRAGPDGRFQFRCEPIAGGQPWRPRHLRFAIEAAGHERLVSDVFLSGDDGECALEYGFVLAPSGDSP